MTVLVTTVQGIRVVHNKIVDKRCRVPGQCMTELSQIGPDVKQCMVELIINFAECWGST